MNRQTLQPQQRSVARIERATGIRVPSREELAASRSQAQVVVQQTVRQADRVARQYHNPNIVMPTKPVAAVQPSRVTFEHMMAPQPVQQPMIRPALAQMAPAMSGVVAMPVPVVAMPVVKKTINDVKISLNKVKNHPKIKQIQAKIPDNIKDIKVRPAEALRYGVVAACLIVAGFLAYDTWQTNQQIQSVFSPEPVSAVETPAVTSDDQGGDGAGAGWGTFPDYTVAMDMPRVLSIPSIDVAARVLAVGLTNNSHVNVPASMWDAGWYDGSVAPGKAGASFITGHYNVGGGGAVFDNLGALNDGDAVRMELGDGTTINYSVYNKETIPADQVDMSAVLATAGDSGEGLNLMTCAGQFTRNGFSHRTIVYTKRV
ncbi:hypothetical protein FACS189431_5030 [Alphaproteobacteria bacterium]|nr:hypothetical protein FACS189431_5030 [Alphaproteobacteria bacterium]